MRGVLDVLKSTIAGGVLFLLPLVVVIVLVEKAIQVARQVFAPLLSRVGDISILGVSLATIASVAALLLLCLIAGLIARTQPARNLVVRLESSILEKIPVYGLLKSMTAGFAGIAADEHMRPVVVHLDDNSVIGLATDDRDDGGLIAVYLPGAPSPISGTVVLVERSRVTQLNATTLEAFSAMKGLGRGSLALLG